MKDLNLKLKDLNKSFKFVQTGLYIYNVVVFDNHIPKNNPPFEFIFKIGLEPSGYVITSKNELPDWIDSYKVVDLLNGSAPYQ